jgi:hypothetical protein
MPTLLEKVDLLSAVRGNILLHPVYTLRPGPVHHLLIAVDGVLIPEVQRAIQENRMPLLPYVEDVCAAPSAYVEEAEMLQGAEFNLVERPPLTGYRACRVQTSQATGALVSFSLEDDGGTTVLSASRID